MSAWQVSAGWISCRRMILGTTFAQHWHPGMGFMGYASGRPPQNDDRHEAESRSAASIPVYVEPRRPGAAFRRCDIAVRRSVRSPGRTTSSRRGIRYRSSLECPSPWLRRSLRPGPLLHRASSADWPPAARASRLDLRCSGAARQPVIMA